MPYLHFFTCLVSILATMFNLDKICFLRITIKTVALRTAGYYITPTYTSYSGHLYYTATGEEITNPDESTTAATKEIRNAVAKQLSVSDEVQTGDLLRFDTDTGLETVDSSSFPTPTP